MSTRRIPLPLLAFALPALALPLGLGLASLWVLRVPPPPIATAPAETVPPVTKEERIYLPLVTPITVSLPGDGPRLKIEIGVAIRAEGGYALLTRLKERPEAVQSGLAETVLRTAEDLGPEASTEDLRAAVPKALRAAMNQRLEDLGEDRAVLEVLITGWARAD
ncbi:MAG: flagellar basal body-associated FliL family protein [Roseovarius sp.]|uniref:flagellar basal body-associated FliL family protein n=1 Tax=Roseovarius sp. TaxID=1486281 RepID=UPI0032EE3B2E